VKIVQIDLAKLIRRNVPVVLGMPRMLAWLAVLSRPLAAVNAALLGFHVEAIAQAKLNGQTEILQNLLNRLVPEAGGRIRVVNQFKEQPVRYLYSRAELQPPQYRYMRSESRLPVEYFILRSESGSLHDFVVLLPVANMNRQKYIEGVVNRYRLATKRFQIQPI
jgi:hypothetical protein